jgi:4'-phosphopantetheinyl transferase
MSIRRQGLTVPAAGAYFTSMVQSGSAWPAGPASPFLPEDEVHVWRVSLEQGAARAAELSCLLSAEERARAGRYRRREHQDRFTASRALLRLLLGRYLAAPPGALSFDCGRRGKPCLAGAHRGSGLRFNLSHSHQLALYAVASGREVGIDVEHRRPQVDIDQIARRFFARPEVEALQSLGPDQRVTGFYNCWTRKEAYLKALGEGIAVPLDRFAVSLLPGEPAVLLEAAAAARWQLRAIDPGPEYAAAVCVEGTGAELRCWQWTF